MFNPGSDNIYNMTQAETTKPKTNLSIARKITLFTMIGAYSISALAGIIAILAGNMDWRIIGTTALIGTLSLIVLASLTVIHIPGWKLLGYGAISFGAISTFLTLGLIWGLIKYEATGVYPSIRPYTFFDFTVDTLMCTWLYSGTLMFASLIVALAQSAGKTSQIIACITTGINILVAFLYTYIYFGFKNRDGFSSNSSTQYETLTKLTVVLAILGSLGVLVTLTVALIEKANNKKTVTPTTDYGFQVKPVETGELKPETVQALTAYAQWRGMDVNAYVNKLLTDDYNTNNPANDNKYLDN